MAEINEIASTVSIKMPSDASGTLDSYIKDERNRHELLFICPYCSFKTPLEIEYHLHIVLIHPDKTGYPNMAEAR
jgi:hypothetical protein